MMFPYSWTSQAAGTVETWPGPDQEVPEPAVRASCQKSLPPYMQLHGVHGLRLRHGRRGRNIKIAILAPF